MIFTIHTFTTAESKEAGNRGGVAWRFWHIIEVQGSYSSEQAYVRVLDKHRKNCVPNICMYKTYELYMYDVRTEPKILTCTIRTTEDLEIEILNAYPCPHIVPGMPTFCYEWGVPQHNRLGRGSDIVRPPFFKGKKEKRAPHRAVQ